MNRWGAPAALGAALAVMLAAVVLLTQAAPADADRGDALARELRCPDCQGLSVADSPTSSAAEIRRQIDEMLASGESPDAVRAHFVARYGEWILLAPSGPLPWLIPFVAIGVGGGALLFWIVRRRGAPARVSSGEPSPELRRRLHEEADALDA